MVAILFWVSAQNDEHALLYSLLFASHSIPDCILLYWHLFRLEGYVMMCEARYDYLDLSRC